MKYFCAVDAASFPALLEQKLADQRARVKRPAYRYVKLPADADTVAIRVYHGRDYDLVAVAELGEEDGLLTLDVHFEDLPTGTVPPLPEDQEAQETSLAAKIAARLTVLLGMGGFLYAAVWGLTYLVGNRNPYLPLIAPVGYWLFWGMSAMLSHRPHDVPGDFARFLEAELGCTPMETEQASDPSES